MRIFYLLEEILPQPTDLSAQIIQLCQSLANLGCKVHLICSRGSAQRSHLCNHYIPHQKKSCNFELHRLLSSKNALLPNFLGRWLFVVQVQNLIQTLKPDWVFASEPTALLYHLNRKVPKVRYGLEIGSLPYVQKEPLTDTAHMPIYRPLSFNLPRKLWGEVLLWRAALAKADLLIASTKFLGKALLIPPYVARKSAQIIPWGSCLTPLSPITDKSESRVELLAIISSATGSELLFLLNAMRLCIGDDRLYLHIALALKVHDQIEREIDTRGLQSAIKVHKEPTARYLHALMAKADAFIYRAEESSSDLPIDGLFVDYCRLGRPIIAPDFPAICELLPKGQARAFLFKPGDLPSFAVQLRRIADPTLRFLTTSALHEAFEANPHKFSMEQRAHEFKCSLQ